MAHEIGDDDTEMVQAIAADLRASLDNVLVPLGGSASSGDDLIIRKGVADGVELAHEADGQATVAWEIEYAALNVSHFGFGTLDDGAFWVQVEGKLTGTTVMIDSSATGRSSDEPLFHRQIDWFSALGTAGVVGYRRPPRVQRVLDESA